MPFTGQKVEQPASTACLLARKCNRLARKMAANMRNAICVRTQTLKVPTQDILLVSLLFCGQGGNIIPMFTFHISHVISKSSYFSKKVLVIYESIEKHA